jgi:hypothetical protein
MAFFKINYLIVNIRGVHSPVRSGFNPKIQSNRKIVFLINITRTEPVQTEPVLFGSGRFFSIKTRKTRLIFITELLRFSRMNFIIIL